MRRRLSMQLPYLREHNQIRTTKYNVLTFLPKNIFEQFHRVAYIYFLFILILNQVPALAVFGRYISLAPLLSVLVVSAVKDAYEDICRWRQDRTINGKECKVLVERHGRLCEQAIEWQAVRVGDLLVVKQDEQLPADMILIDTDAADGICYVDTVNLDGESNLKPRHALTCTQARTCQTKEQDGLYYKLDWPEGEITFEAPNREIYKFEGFLQLGGGAARHIGAIADTAPAKARRERKPGASPEHVHLTSDTSDHEKLEEALSRRQDGDVEGSEALPGNVRRGLTTENLLLRGCTLRNTGWVIGVVAYAGDSTKVQLNATGIHAKRSKLEKLMNKEMLILALIGLALCVIGTIGADLWIRAKHVERVPYFGAEESNYDGASSEALISFFGFIILFQIIVPISLYISMELVRGCQAYFMSRDIEMYDSKTDIPMTVKSLNINEDLGQVQYVFSDKTGTLTENEMVFRILSVGGIDFRLEEAVSNGKGVNPEHAGDTGSSLPRDGVGQECESLASVSERLCDKTGSQAPNMDPIAQDLHEALLTMSVCNTVITSPASASGMSHYQGESPDEVALVCAAKAAGYALRGRTSDVVEVQCVQGKVLRFQLLALNPFSSDRKRMSVLLRCLHTGTISLLVKVGTCSFTILRPAPGLLTSQKWYVGRGNCNPAVR